MMLRQRRSSGAKALAVTIFILLCKLDADEGSFDTEYPALRRRPLLPCAERRPRCVQSALQAVRAKSIHELHARAAGRGDGAGCVPGCLHAAVRASQEL